MKQLVHSYLGGKQGFRHPTRNECTGLVRPDPNVAISFNYFLTPKWTSKHLNESNSFMVFSVTCVIASMTLFKCVC